MTGKPLPFIYRSRSNRETYAAFYTLSFANRSHSPIKQFNSNKKQTTQPKITMGHNYSDKPITANTYSDSNQLSTQRKKNYPLIEGERSFEIKQVHNVDQLIYTFKYSFTLKKSLF